MHNGGARNNDGRRHHHDGRCHHHHKGADYRCCRGRGCYDDSSCCCSRRHNHGCSRRPDNDSCCCCSAGTTTVADAAETTTLAGVAEPPVGDSAEPVVHDAGGDGDAGTPEEGKFVVGEAASPTASPAVEGKTGDAPEEETSGATESTGAAEPSDTGADDGATPTGPEEDEAGAAGADEVAAGANDVATSAADCNAALLETTGSLCMNGGVCEFKRANCNNADLPFDTPVCACPSVAFGTCFYGEHCQMQTSDCSADTLSCNIVKSLRSNVDPATAVCSTDEWPARLCTAAQPPALAGASSATLLEEDGIAPAKKSGAGGAVAAVLLIIFAAVLLGMYHHKRQQAVAGDGDGGSTNPMYLEPFGTKILSSVENPMYLEPVPLASPDYIAPAPVGGAEPMYEIGNVGDEPVYELGNGEGDEPLYDLGNGDGDGDGYLAVGDGVDADAMYDLAGNATLPNFFPFPATTRMDFALTPSPASDPAMQESARAPLIDTVPTAMPVSISTLSISETLPTVMSPGGGGI